MEDRVSLSASPWSDVDASEVAALLAGKQFVADELVVAVRSTTGSTTFQDLLAIEGAKDAATAAAIRGATLLGSALSDAATQIYQVTLAAGVDLTGVISAVSRWSNVEWAAPNFVYTHSPQELVPNDPSYSSQWHHAQMQTSAAWDISQGSGVIVAVMDDGVDWDHVDLAANIWNNADEIAGNGIDDDANGFVDDVRGWDFSSGDNNPDQNGTDFHGTHVAGIIGARTNNAAGVAGVAGQATIMPVRFYGSGAWTSTVIFNSYKYAVDNGAKIINTSYDIDGFVGDATFQAALNYAYSRGVLLFNSAGNGDTSNPPRGNFDQVLLVASTNSSDLRDPTSNYGTTIDISAPGSGIYSTLPNNAYGTLSGTSMASPNAAAVAALVWAANPTWTRDQVAARLLGTADNLDSLNPAYADLLGTGRINAFRALTTTVAAPVIEGVTKSIQSGTTYLSVQVDSRFDDARIENLANWELRRDGADNLFGTADDVVVSLTRVTDYMVGSNQIQFSFATGPDDRYRLTAKSGPSGLQSPTGVQLDGNQDGVAGDDYTFLFAEGTSTAPTLPAFGSQTIAEDSQLSMTFVVTDSDTPYGELTFSVSSDNPTLLRNAADVLRVEDLGGGTYRLFAKPEPGASGTVKITVNVGDGASTTTRQFDLIVNSVNDAPSFEGRDVNVWYQTPGLFTSIQGWAKNISAGVGESGQSLQFVVTNDNPLAFTTQPTVSATGTLTFTRDGRWSGSVANVTVQLVDDGGTAGGGVDTFTRTFKIEIGSGVNISPIATQSILEDQSTGNLLFAVTDEYLNPLAVSYLSASGTMNGSSVPVATGYLGNGQAYVQVTPSSNQHGTVLVNVSAGIPGRAAGFMQFSVNVTSVNDAPTFNLGGDLGVAADGTARTYAGFASSISAGASNESSQTLTFEVSNDNAALFDVAPTIAADGTLSFKAKAGMPGSALVTVRLKDNGGTANNGADTSIARTFVINNVLSGSITPVEDRTILEDGATGPIPFGITWINPSTTGRSVTVTSGDVELLSQANLSLVDLGGGNYTVAATPAANRHGVVRITITATDSGVSTTETFDLTVTPVNDAPSFSVGPNVVVGNDGVEQVVTGAATSLFAGPYDGPQALSWIVSTDSPSLFAVQPTMDLNGTLRFTPVAGAVGTAVITLRLQDDGGTAGGGVDVSIAKTFSVTLESRGRVTGRIWNDVDRDGIQDGGETGAVETVVELFRSADGTAGNADDVSLGTARTAADGTYAFHNIAAAANLFVVIHTPPTALLSPEDVGSDESVDGDFAAATARTAMFSLAVGQTVDQDAGLYVTPQDFGWAFQLGTGQAGGTGNFDVRRMLLDASGNTYVTGNYTLYGRDLDPGAGVTYLPYSDVTSTFIAKLDASGGLVWARAVRGAENLAAAVDASGNILLNGAYTGTVDFDPGAGSFQLTSTVSSGSAGYVLKLAADGTFVWARSVGAVRNFGSDMTVSSTGDVIVVGTFGVAADFDPGAGVKTLTPSGEDAYVAKLDQSGSLVWAQRFGGTSFTRANAVAVDAAGSVIVGGSFNATVDFDPGTGVANRTSVSTLSSDSYVVKLTASGTFVWADAFGGTSSDGVSDLALNSTGDVVAVGYFVDSIDLDPGAGTNIRTGLNTYSDSVYVVKLSSAGTHVWGGAVRSGGPSGIGGVLVDAAGSVHLTGRVDSNAVFDAATGADVQGGASGGFLWTLTSAGAHDRLERWDGATGLGITGNDSGDYVLFGTLGGTTDFDSGPATTYVAPLSGGTTYFATRRTAADGHVWSRRFGDASNLSVTDMATDSAGDVYAVGSVVGVVDFDSGVGVARNADGAGIGYLAKYTRDGALLWMRFYVVAASSDSPKVAVDAAGNAAVLQSLSYDAALSKFDAHGNLLWSHSFVRTNLTDMAFDSTGNLVVVGIMNSAGDVDPGAGTFTVAAGDSFAVRFDRGGNLVQAANLGTIKVLAVAIAADGDLALSGYFSGTRDFDPGVGTSNLTASSYYAMFVTRLDSAGQLLWATKRDGAIEVVGGDVAVDATGAVVALGRRYRADGNYDDYLVKLDPSGNELWSRTTNVNAWSPFNNFSNVTLDPNGNILISGSFQGQPTFDPGVTVTSAGSNDWFVARYDTDGAFEWVKSFGYWSSDVFGGIALDAAGNLFVGGTFYGFIEADPGQGYYGLGSDTTTSYSGGVGLISRWNASYMRPEINVTGNGVDIAAGDDTPGAADFTDFGVVPVGAPPVTRRFVVANSGNVDLLLNGPVRIEISGAARDDFSVTLVPADRIGMGNTAAFEITYSPTASGARNALITIRNNDTDESIYSFAVRGGNTSPPVIAAISDQTAAEDSTRSLDFVVTHPDSVITSVTVQSSDTTLLPNDRITLTDNGGGNYGLSMAPAADRSGETFVTITADDGRNTVTRTFRLTVTPVNDAPTFTLPSLSLTLAADGTAKNYVGWATGISAGATEESGQSLTFLVTTDRPDLFAAGPAIDAAGKLTFTPSALAGTATVTVRLQDNGGTTDGGVDTSIVRTFTITTKALPTVSPIADQTILVNGELRYDFSVADADTPAGNLAVTVGGSNSTLFPAGHIGLAYRGGGNYTLVAQPVAGQAGEAFITITVRDDQSFDVTRTFRLTVGAVAPPTPAKVTGVYARGTAWSAAFTAHLQAQGLTDSAGWLELSRGAGQTDTLPWANVNQLLLKFADLPALDAGDVQIVAPAGVTLPGYTVAFDQGTQTATVTFDQALPAGKFLVFIDDAIGNFDGEWTDNASTASGNGTAGGDFEFRFNVLPGDVDRSQSVSFGEIGQQRLMLGRTTAAGDYNYRQDYDGSGSITFGDVGLARGNLGQGIGSLADPTAPAGESISAAGGPESIGPESYGPESYGPESYDMATSESFAYADESYASSAVRGAVIAPVVDASATFFPSTLEARVLIPVATDAGRVSPIVVPSPAAAVDDRDLARAWNAVASLPVVTVLGRSHVAAPAAVRLLAAETPFTTLDRAPSDDVSAVHRRAILDPAQSHSIAARWNRLRRSSAPGQVSDLALSSDAAASLE